jgi:parvulin-like peptidyl-prolyl isomerase
VTIRSCLSLSRAGLLLAALATAGCSRSAAADVVARVGGTDVTTEELRAYVETLDAPDRSALAKDPALLSQVVRAYLARQAVLKEAQSRKWDQRPEVRSQLDRVHEQALTEIYLQSVSRPADGYPSDAEVRAAYDANRKAFEVPRQWRVAQIFISAGKDVDQKEEEKARSRLEDVQRKLAAKGADFAAIAKGDSDDKEGALRGGEIGWLTEAQMIKGIRSTVAALAKGAVSNPVRLDDGWHILEVLETKEPFTRALQEVREALTARLRAERTKANRQAYLAKLLEQNPPAINELALSKVLVKK